MGEAAAQHRYAAGTRLVLLLACWLLPAAATAAAALSNQLANHPSPYLAMHGADPVHWQPWSEATLQKARALNRPLLISIGYFSCHWCHVMQRESYQDPAVAKLLNDYFVPVKVDRELEPALDAHLIEFVELTRGQAGWPLNVFLTPDGYPIAGIVYAPRERFYAILDDLRRRWEKDSRQLSGLAHKAMDEWAAIRSAAARQPSTATAFAHSFKTQVGLRQDELAGGFGQQTKFPMAPQLQALLWLSANHGDNSLDGFVRLTLDQMAEQGLHDLLGGGFFRYVTDPAWQTPHYEKMLYDNAQLALLYLGAAEQFESMRYRDIGLATLDFMLSAMRSDAGYFISSFSAVDDQGREGFYYLWDEASLRDALSGDELRVVQAAWFGEHREAAEYGKLPRWQKSPAQLARDLGVSQARLEALLDSARDKLLEARSGRSLPADDKGLAAWNGLALSALAAGYALTKDDRYAGQAEQLASYLSTRLWDGKQLLRARAGNRVLAEASLEDYALVARGLWDWNRQKPARERDALVEKLVRIAWQRYFRDSRWTQSDTALIPMLEGRIAAEDSPLPSTTAAISYLSAHHQMLKEDDQVQEQLAGHLAQVRAHLADSAFWYASYLELLEPGQSVP
jgi:uncharacterized protein YyaL (SSP411 family)